MIDKIKDRFQNIHSFIKSNKDILDRAISEELLELTGDKFKEKLENIVSKDGVLRIGVVGQVKAGKSSFINALLFDGKDILPKASTPMTAALTVIKYSQKPFAEVEFYSKADWEIIERRAKDFEEALKEVGKDLKKSRGKFSRVTKDEIEEETKARVGDAISASYELYQMAKSSNLDIDSYIGKKEVISENIYSVSDLVGKLQNYVGANGKFTPITKNTVLHLDIPTLKEIEIIDTPGTNDPIISRGQTTRDFLSRCDAVFLLSYSGQFMGQEDTEFLVNTLPSEGISDIIVLGSKFDSVLVDEFKKYKGDIRLALRDLYNKLSTQADDSLEKIISSNPNKPIMKKLRESRVKFISGIAYNIAKKDKRNLDEMEQHALNSLEKRYKLEFSKEVLFDLANIDAIREKDLEKLKSKKDEILSQKLENFIAGQREKVLKGLNELEANIQDRLKDLESSDIQELTKRAKTLEEGFERARGNIEQIFTDFEFDIKEKLYQLINEVDDRRYLYTGVEKRTRSKEVYSHTESRSTWYKPWTWGDEEDIYETVYYDIAKVNEAVDKAVKFVREANSVISENWKKMIDISKFERSLIKEAMSAFDLSDTSFNKNQIINPVRNALNEIKIRPYRVQDRKYIDKITSTFSSSEVEGSDISRLESLLSDVLYEISNDIEREIESKISEISNILDSKRQTFVSTIKSNANSTINKLKEDLKNKEASINRDKRLLEEIDNLKIGL
jgi:hypothetical protein